MIDHLIIVVQPNAFWKLLLQIQPVWVVKKKELVCSTSFNSVVQQYYTWDIYVAQTSKTSLVKDPVGNEPKYHV